MSARKDQLKFSVQYSLHAKIMFNINLVGKKSVGKSSLIIRQIKDTFGSVPKGKGGFQFYSKTIARKNEDLSVQFWDTVGQSEYNSMTRNFLRKAAAIILVYESIDHLQEEISELKKQLNQYAHESVKLCLVRTKTDIHPVTEQQRRILKTICQVTYPHEIFYHGEVSAKTNDNVHKYFLQLIDLMFKCYEEQEDFREVVSPTKDSFLLDSPSKNDKQPIGKKKCC